MNDGFLITMALAVALALMLVGVMLVALGWTHYSKGIPWKRMWEERKHRKKR